MVILSEEPPENDEDDPTPELDIVPIYSKTDLCRGRKKSKSRAAAAEQTKTVSRAELELEAQQSKGRQANLRRVILAAAVVRVRRDVEEPALDTM
jgi:hypothetical protein